MKVVEWIVCGSISIVLGFFGAFLWYPLLLWAIVSLIVAAIADSKELSVSGWWFYALLLAPIAFLHVLFAAPNQAQLDKRAIAVGESRKCPHCAEIVKAEAKVCRYCGRDIAQSLDR